MLYLNLLEKVNCVSRSLCRMRKYKGNDLGVRQIDEFAVIVSLRKKNLKFLTRASQCTPECTTTKSKSCEVLNKLIF